MTEVVVNGTSGGNLDFTETKASLGSSSTSLRIGLLHALEERLSKNGRPVSILYSLAVSVERNADLSF
jgi:hypothetical protein